MPIVGRTAELGEVDTWFAGSNHARAALLVIQGQAGIGKTSIWSEATSRASQAGWQVLSCRPGASDAALAYVGLTDLLSVIPDDGLRMLPEPQRRRTATRSMRWRSPGSCSGSARPRPAIRCPSRPITWSWPCCACAGCRGGPGRHSP
jgi:hypothetical protein